VPIASGVDAKVEGSNVRVKGPKATLLQAVAPYTKVEVRDGTFIVSRSAEHNAARAAHGLMRAVLANMIEGVTKGFERKLDITGVGYRGEVKGKDLVLTVGYSHIVKLPIPTGLDVRMESQTRVSVAGPDKKVVGQFAANVRKVKPPEPYKGKGIKYAEETIRRKVGKSAAAGGKG